MFGFQFLTTAVALLGFASNVAYAGQLVDHQQVSSESLRVNTWVWTGVHQISRGAMPTHDEIYSLAVEALNDAYEDYEAAQKAGIKMGNCPAPEVLTATLTNDRRLYFSTPMKSVDHKIPFVARAQDSTDPAAMAVTKLLRTCSKKPPPESVARLHEHNAACGEISTLYMYATDHSNPSSISGSTDVTIGYNGGRYSIKPPCSRTAEGRTYGCKDVTHAAHFTDVTSARKVDVNAFRKNRMTKLPNPRLQTILSKVPTRGCRRDEGGPTCNITMPAF